MHVAYINKGVPKPAANHYCNVCKHNFGWREDSRQYIYCVEREWNERIFLICGNECHKQAIKEKLIIKFMGQSYYNKYIASNKQLMAEHAQLLTNKT